jgi:hypothetical protein
MSAIRTGVLAVVLAMSGCGSVPEDMVPDAGPDAPKPPGTTTYRGILAMSPTVTFGGTSGGNNFCSYTIKLTQVELELNLLTTGEVKGGTSQALATETVLASTTPPCTAGPGITPNIHKFTFKSATAVTGGYMVLMDGDPANQPTSTLAITITPAAGAFTAAARWTRTGTSFPVLVWNVTSNLTLTVK